MRAFIAVIVAGLIIGLLWPSGDRTTVTSASAASGERRETVIEREGNGHFYTHAKVNDAELIHFVVDTGAWV